LAIASTIIATALAGLSFFQYQERNQIIKQIEQIRRQNNLPSGQWNLSSYSLESEWDKFVKIMQGKKKSTPLSLELELENFGNIVTGKEPLIYWDLNHLINKMQEKNTLSEGDIKTKQDEINTLEKAKKELEDKNNSLQSRINELEKYTYVNFCNTTSYTIDAAFAYGDGKVWHSKGWWIVKPGECREVGQNYNGNVYVYGMYNRGEREWGSGKYSFCVDIANDFSISESDKGSCSGTNQKKVTMSEFSVYPGRNYWSF
jgi:uncharacterized membrane protein